MPFLENLELLSLPYYPTRAIIMRDYLPPMQSLRSFAAAARLSSISKAANELCVTQGAVSKQIKLLESFLSVALFTRGPSGVSLTPAGRN